MPALVSLWHTLWFKLTAAFLLVAVVGVVVVSILTNQATTVGLRRFLDEDAGEAWSALQVTLTDYYTRQGSWAGVESLLSATQPGRGQGSAGLSLLDENGQVIAGAGGQRNRPTSYATADLSLPIESDGRQVGTLLIGAPGSGINRAGEQFLDDVNQAIIWGGVIAVLLALFLGAILALRLTRPLILLTRATHEMASGDLAQHVKVSTQDELGELATSFNQMADALNQAELQRQQLLADVAHELRTPLSVMRSQIEAMLDGIFEMTPDNLAVAYEESVLLGRLIEDLRTLSLATAGQLPLNRTAVDLRAMVDQSVAAFTPLSESEGVLLQAEVPPDPQTVSADADRIMQVLSNLIANALRYAGKGKADMPQVQILVSNQDASTQVSVTDNGPGLSSEMRLHVFDRFWRADAARGREQGGSGLGLAICKAIVEAHDGQIWVESQPGKGATFFFALPKLPEQEAT